MKTCGKGDVMTWDDAFQFRCHSKIDCFNTCCRDITIFLTPFDVIRMKTALGLSSTDFLEQYTHILFNRKSGLPAIALRMTQDENKQCPFVVEEGCRVYPVRPYSCRMYPLDTEQGVEFTFTVCSDVCHGLLEKEEWTIERWRKEQGIYDYDDLDHQLKDVMAADEIWEAKIEDPRMQDMFLMSLYDMDRFREFVFNSSFMQKFKIDDDILEKIKDDDVNMLYFASQWLRFVLFGQKGFLKIDKEFLAKKKQEVLSNQRQSK